MSPPQYLGVAVVQSDLSKGRANRAKDPASQRWLRGRTMMEELLVLDESHTLRMLLGRWARRRP